MTVDYAYLCLLLHTIGCAVIEQFQRQDLDYWPNIIFGTFVALFYLVLHVRVGMHMNKLLESYPKGNPQTQQTIYIYMFLFFLYLFFNCMRFI